MTLTIKWEIQPNPEQHDAIWYYGTQFLGTATLVKNNEEFSLSIYCDGETRFHVPYLNEDGTFDPDNYEVIRYADQWESRGIFTDKQLNEEIEKWYKAGYEIHQHNSWFDLYDEDGTHLDCVTHEIPDAVAQAQAVLEEVAALGGWNTYLNGH